MARRRAPEQIEFTSADPSPAIDALSELVAAGAGWINLFPGVDEEDVEVVSPSPVAALFRAAGPPIPQVTIVAPQAGRGGQPTPAQVGITHGVGTRVIPRLAREGIIVPEDWRLVQDHVRRGLVINTEDPLDVERAIRWSLQAAVALCPVRTNGNWIADVHAG